MEPVTEDDFLVTEHPNPNEIARHFAAAKAATDAGQRAAFVQLLLAIEAPAEAGIFRGHFVAAWPVAAIGAALDQGAAASSKRVT